MKKHIFIIIIILLGGMSLKSQQSVISGKVINGNGLTIRLMTYTDQISYLRQTLASSPIGPDETFSFTFDNPSIRFCWLDIEFQQVELFVQPGQSYVIDIEMNSESLTTSYYNRSTLPSKLIKDDNDNLNTSIQDFNQIYNDFLLNIADNSQSQSSKYVYENFNQAVSLRFQKSNHSYLQDYIKYKLASVQMFMRVKSRLNIGLEYIKEQPVLYDNLEYMDFFHLYFDKYFLTSSKFLNYNKSYDLINGNLPLAGVLDSLKADPVLDEIWIRELVLLDGLKDLYNVAGFTRSRILYLTSEISKTSKYFDNRRLATNLLTRFRRLQSSSPAPEFTLKGFVDQKEYKLADFSGRKVYLAFFESANPACQSELGQIAGIYEEYKDKVAFVAIAVDKNPAQLADYLGRSAIPWLVLDYGGNLELLENYDAITFPHFLLISDKGKILNCPAPSPSENIRKLLDL